MSSPILALHGWLGRGADWASVRALLPEAATVLAPGLPGHGPAPAPAGAFTMDGAADFALDALDAAGAERAVVAGYSMGGRVALHLALRHPGRVAGLVLISALPGLRTAAEREQRRALDAERARRLLADPGAFLSEWYAARLFDPIDTPSRAALVADRLAHARPDGWARALVGLSVGAQPWHGDRLREIRTPVAVLAGAEDAKFSSIARAMAGASGFACTLAPRAGHALLAERPDVVAEEIQRLSDPA